MQLRAVEGERPVTRTWIRARVRHYAELVSLGFTPAVEFGDVENGRAEYIHAKRTVRVDLGEQLCRHDADDTAAHETAHGRWPGLPCNGKRSAPLFRKRVLAMRMGVKAGPPGSRLPAEYRA